MSKAKDLRQAILDAANSKVAKGTPVSLLEIGPTLLIEQNFTQEELVNALFAMQGDTVIELLDGNRMRVL
ncbi:hypothetical protein K9B32_10505 [Rhizobium sp. 3T7]|uniref:hypothetical protein n=1 Tax=Rhizobium sp. 3T7 TaxID=2874922 RepID=UPI001CCAB615|nr:hypothetical protein [Rhizobium sp. 3T7]MBZ9790549.1 hypothetical protein [Rhizobium sp. 3T7]